MPEPWRRWPLLAAGLVALAGTTGGLAAVHLAPLTAEFSFFCALILLTLVRRGGFAWPWSLWLGAIVALDDLRGLQAVGFAPHASDVIRFESWLFGGVPTVRLQSHFAGAGLTWYDVVVSLVYLMHSPAPLICGAVLWVWRRELFTPFVASMLLCGAAGLVTYLLFPEAPPWLAAQNHLMEPVRRITNEVIAKVGPLNSVYAGADPLPNAAMPSLHVTYPCLVAYWTIVAFGRRALWIAAYPTVLAVGVIYLGEHWAIDVIVGIAYAAAAIAAVRYWARRSARKRIASG